MDVIDGRGRPADGELTTLQKGQFAVHLIGAFVLLLALSLDVVQLIIRDPSWVPAIIVMVFFGSYVTR